jgi:hypothetical protein
MGFSSPPPSELRCVDLELAHSGAQPSGTVLMKGWTPSEAVGTKSQSLNSVALSGSTPGRNQGATRPRFPKLSRFLGHERMRAFEVRGARADLSVIFALQFHSDVAESSPLLGLLSKSPSVLPFSCDRGFLSSPLHSVHSQVEKKHHHPRNRCVFTFRLSPCTLLLFSISPLTLQWAV